MVNYEGDFEVIKTCFWLSLISIYCFLYLLQLFMEFCWFVAVGCSEFSFFFLCRFPRFLLLPLLSKLWQRRTMKFLLLDFLFPFFPYAVFIRFLVSWYFSIWFQFWVYFSWYIVFFSSSFYIGLDFLFPFFWLCNFYWIFGFLGFFYLISILGFFWFDI